MALWQIVFDPDLIRHDPHSSMIFSWMLCNKYTAGASLMGALEAVNHALLSDISFNLMAVTYGEKIRRCGKDLWISILSRPPQNEIEKNGKATWPHILSQPIRTYQYINIQSPSTVGIISKNMPLYKMLSLYSTRIGSRDMGNGSKLSSQSQMLDEQIHGSSFQPRQVTRGWTIAPYLSLMDSIETKRISAISM